MPIKDEKDRGNEKDEKDEKRIGGSIALVGFGILQPVELIVVKKIVGNYVRKITEVANYKELRLRLKQHQHAKSFLHEIEAEAVITKGQDSGKNLVLAAKSTQHNLYTALSEALEKIYAEALHHERSAKEVGEEMIRQEKKEERKEKSEER